MSVKRNTLIQFENIEDFDFKAEGFSKPARENPRFWNGVAVGRYDFAYAPSFPKIEAAYKKAGVSIYRPNNAVEAPTKPSEPVQEPIEAISEGEVEQPVESLTERSSDDWKELNATKMKELAKEVLGKEYNTKKEAQAALEEAGYK